MKEKIVLNKSFVSSDFPVSAFVSLVGGEGLSERATSLGLCSDSPSPPTSPANAEGGRAEEMKFLLENIS